MLAKLRDSTRPHECKRECVPEAMNRLDNSVKARLRIVQQCRPEDLERGGAAYAGFGITAKLDSFFTDIPDRLAATHPVIARAGASTVAEVTAVGRPAILVPYPYAIDGHQERVGESIFLFAPSCVTVTTASSEESAAPSVMAREEETVAPVAPSPAWGTQDAING